MADIVNGRIVISIADIRSDFPEFASQTDYPDAFIASAIKRAGWYVSTKAGQAIPDETRIAMLESMSAHLLFLAHQQMGGGASGSSASGSTGQLASASIGGVSVAIVAPRNRDAQEYWLNQSRYGQEYLALLASLGGGAILYGGSWEKVF